MSKKTENNNEQLAKDLLFTPANGYAKMSDKDMEKSTAFSEGYKDFMNIAKTERESVDYTVREAEKHGFVPFDAATSYQPGDKVYYNNRGKSICLAVIGKEGCKNGVRILAAHIDSPRLDLKPIPLFEANEIAMLKTHYYGGVKKYQWTSIPLSMHGKIVKCDGTEITINIGEKEGDPQFCITDLLPHLGKDQYAKKLGDAIEGEALNILAGSLPAGREDGEKQYKLNVLKILNEQYGIVEEDLVSAEIEFVPAFKATDIGFDRSMIGAYGHDDRVCSYPSLQAILNCKNPTQTVVTVLADKEEIGSVGNTGLSSQFLAYFVADLAALEGMEARHVLSKSTCLSADVTAAYDPNYASAYEAGNSTFINRGIGIAKYTGSRGKSGGSDCSAEFLGQIRTLLNENEVLWQIGELGKVDQGGGGTVACYVASLNVDVLDVGVPVLSMHAPWEVVSKIDLYMTYKAFKAYFEA